MPELPEVETVRRVLHQRYAGRRIEGVRLGSPTFYRAPSKKTLAALEGAVVAEFRRRGKYLIAVLRDRGDVVFHLGMSGRITIGEEGPHVRLEFRIGDDAVRFHDARRFGRVGCPLPALGPEPLDADFNADYLAGVLRGRKAAVKALIMDQGLVAGLGNIYAAEALHAAGVRPARAGRSLSRVEIASLAAACRAVLTRAVESGGSTLGDESFLDPLGRPGSMQNGVKVYGRRDCGTCGGILKSPRTTIAGRSTKFCPTCQR